MARLEMVNAVFRPLVSGDNCKAAMGAVGSVRARFNCKAELSFILEAMFGEHGFDFGSL